MRKTFLILAVMISLSGCKNSPYAYQPYNPMCLKLKYYELTEAEAIALYDNLSPKNREAIEMNRTAVKQDCMN